MVSERRQSATPRRNSRREVCLQGIAAAPGITVATAFLLDSETFDIRKRNVDISQVPKEIARFEDALIRTRAEILTIQERISQEMGSAHGEIFHAHLLVLEDRMLIEDVITRVEQEQVQVDYAFLQSLEKYLDVFSKIDDEYLRERTIDIEDVGKRVLRSLLGKERETLSSIQENCVVVAYDLSPSDTATMHREHVVGLATDIGGRTSHTAIMAKALEIPAVVGLEGATAEIQHGDLLIVDGDEGLVYVQPTQRTIKQYRSQQKRREQLDRDLLQNVDLPCETRDGHQVLLSANIEVSEEAGSVLAHGAEGIGLYRTEYFYMNRSDLPSEEEHYQGYCEVAAQVAPHPVVIRTLDLGGDKFLSQLDIPREMNPYLGWRAIRFCLAQPDIFKVQLRAILRAAVCGNIKMMYPMISGVDELRDANRVLEEAKEELRVRGVPFQDDLDVGAMIEVPSAAVTCDLLATECKFFSIGTNDLIQYALAVDRVNEKIAYLYEPAHPAVLRLIKNIVDTGRQAGLWVAMCGEMAGEPALSLLLLGLGLDQFSTSPVNVPAVKQAIRSTTMEQARAIAEHALTLATGTEVDTYVQQQLNTLLAESSELAGKEV